ncbi:hypothetical protein GCM10007207_24040 [Asaia siamensis]|uniref:Uncharacterized protein n=1 Tax=Asaia siamensis TaxID=110479 RepID=A0ABQ1MBF5_9PROT|nr:hypothetical protein AA0323_1722 [Asaia siamensis NRIC 0323]GGC37689.1 hypothetical protein GCM10007207_24040 [Asaia siamensis]
MAIGGNLIELLDENRALLFEILDNGTVVHDLMTDIDRRAIAAQGFFHHADGPINASAKATRPGQKNTKRLRFRSLLRGRLRA